MLQHVVVCLLKPSSKYSQFFLVLRREVSLVTQADNMLYHLFAEWLAQLAQDLDIVLFCLPHLVGKANISC